MPDAAPTPAGGQRAVVAAARDLRAAGRAFALALVVETEGSTYRKPGALALVADDGRRVGVISGGCLEEGLVTLARAALDAGQPRDTVFDTRDDDDLLFGSGSGCRGRMRVVALPTLPGAPAAAIEAIVQAHEARRALSLTLESIAPDLGLTGRLTLPPPPLLLAFGAGPEAAPLTGIARTLGWYVWIADHRPALLGDPRLENADRRLAGRPQEVLAGLGATAIDAALVMTHGAEWDLAALRGLAPREIAYVGLLGPKARRDELLARLTEAERRALDGRLRAPVGLKLGGEGPEAIVLGIVAELQQALRAAA